MELKEVFITQKTAKKFFLALFSLTLGVLGVTSCWFGSSDYDTVKGSVKVFSVTEKSSNPQGSLVGSPFLSLQAGLQPRDTGETYSFNNAGPADSITLTLRGISFIMKGGDEVKGLELESAPRTIQLTGSSGGSEGDTITDIPIPVGTIEKVKLFFDPFATMKGTIPAKTYSLPEGGTQTLSVRTRSQYYYDSFKEKIMDTKGTLTNRDDDEEATSPPALFYQVLNNEEPEDALICLSTGTQEYFVVETPLNKTIDDNTTPIINIAADLSRMLRFSVNGTELVEDSTGVMFTSNHLVNYLFAAFVGSGGTIQGYEYSYESSGNFDAAWARKGWLVLVYDSQGNFAYGALVPDSFGFGSPEGYITEYTQDNQQAVTFKVVKDKNTQFNIENFRKLSRLTDSPVEADLTNSTDWALSIAFGEVRFTLKYNVNY